MNAIEIVDVFPIPRIAYATTLEEARALVDEIRSDSEGRAIAADLETAPNEAEAVRIAALATELAAEGKPTKAQLTANAKIIAAEIKAAATNPHRGRVRLAQLHAGGRAIAVLDIFKTGREALALLSGLPLIFHNAHFDTMFLEAAGVRIERVHCTMQAAALAANGRILKHRVTRAEFVMKEAELERLGHERASLVRLTRHGQLPGLKDSVAAFLGVDLPKEEQASDWGAENLSPSQIAYAAIDALAVWRLKSVVFRELGSQTDVYRTQIAATPAIARMQLRGIGFDAGAHASLMRTFAQDRAEAAKALIETCGEAALAYRTDAGIEAFVRAAAPDEYDTWPRSKPKTLKANKTRPETLKPGKLKTAKDVLTPRADLPGVRAFMDLRRIDKRIESFGASLAACVTVATGRIHAGYRVAGTKAGRSSCREPNIQQTPQDREFRALYVAAEGMKLIDADYANMEARAFAELSCDKRMLEIFADPGGDLHASTALSFIGGLGVAHRHDVTPDERKQAKTTNFAIIYGGGAGALLKQAKMNGRELSREEAEDWIAAFESAYSQAVAWRNAYVEQCVRRDYVVIGKDAEKGGGRIYPLARLVIDREDGEDASPRTVAANLPVQGICALIAMTAIASIDRTLRAEAIEGGLVLFDHDELMLEVRHEDVPRAAQLLERAMIDAFVLFFPNASTVGLVDVHVGDNWAAAKEKDDNASAFARFSAPALEEVDG